MRVIPFKNIITLERIKDTMIFIIDFWILHCYQYISGSLRRICQYDETSRWWANAKKGQFYLEYNDVKVFVANRAPVKGHCQLLHIVWTYEFWCLSTGITFYYIPFCYWLSINVKKYFIWDWICRYHISILRQTKV